MPSIRFAPAFLLAGALSLGGALSLHAGALHAQGAGDLPSLAVGETVSGSLTAESPRSRAGGPFQAWRFEARAGDRIVADARSTAFDAYLVLARLVGGITEIVRENDDGGEGTDARILWTVEDDGSYVLMVRSWSETGLGPFTLSLADRGPAPPAELRPLPMGTTIRDEIDSNGAAFVSDWGDEIPFHFWTFEGRAGEGVRIAMDARGFDAYLELGRMQGGEFEAEAWDDDGGEGTNALLRHILERTGPYVIRARPLGPYFSEGAYTLALEPWVPSPPVRRELPADGRGEGTFTSEDAILPEGPYVQEWVYQARGGERVRIRMRSDEVDSYLSVGWEDEEGRFVEVAYNDDAPDDGLNSLVELTLDRAGPWIIRTHPLSQGSMGRYTVHLEVVGG